MCNTVYCGLINININTDVVMSGGPVCVSFPNQFPLGNPENVPGKLEIHFDDLLVESIQRK